MLDPTTRGVFEALEGGTAFDRSLENQITSVGNRLGSISDQLPSDFVAVSPDIQNMITGVPSRITSTIDQVGPFSEHVASQFDGLGQNLSLFSSSQKLENEMAGEDSNACGSMHDFFGSITEEGPSLIGQIGQKSDSLLATVQQFKTAYADLQSSIQSAKGVLEGAIQDEIAATADQAKISQLQGLLGQVQSQFGTGYASDRSSLVASALDMLSTSRKSSVTAAATSMGNLDTLLSSHASSISGLADEIETHGGALGSIVDSEQGQMQNAVSRLTTLGEASSMQSLFRTNPCVQTLLGYVGTDALLSKLGQ